MDCFHKNSDCTQKDHSENKNLNKYLLWTDLKFMRT